MATIKIGSEKFTLEVRDVPEATVTKIWAMLSPPDEEARLRASYESGAISKIVAIKELRNLTPGLTLKDAKDQVDTWVEPRNV